MTVVAYTDGSATLKHLPAGAGVVIYDGDPTLNAWALAPVAEASRYLGLGTNNHAELCAIRVALYLTTFEPFKGRRLIVRSDSGYSIKMVHWRGALDPERPNAKLIDAIRRELRGRVVTFEHVFGHTGIPGNVRADKLANIGRLQTWKDADAESPEMVAKRTFGVHLRELRTAANLSPGALGRAAGIIGLRIVNMEMGTAPPPSDLMLRVLAKALAVDLEPLLEAARVTRRASALVREEQRA